ncbi:M48 family metallopeptidase [Zoogloea sp. LCSB751]|uniref:tetratricopeptide repeat protein n=1 Tax=Zoogloea sp. LCSB751 TaxID=1965277 RepID=UPI001C1F8A45|nr:tetratricopeptide repeat protein [Zoogloea sp. LCSB751]
MSRKTLIGLMMLAATTFMNGAVLAAEPSLHQVYQAAEAGKLDEAQSMMREVLQAHPNSGKAHYVEAELLAKQGQLHKAESELATAEKLAPGLPFAKPQAVQELKNILGGSHKTTGGGASAATFQPATPAVAQSSVPWGLLLTGVGLIAFIAFVARFMSRRNAQPAMGGAAYGGGGLQPYGAGGAPYGGGSGGGYAGGYGGAPAPSQPGLGSQVMGGLATGAAVGAGMVAGQALMHHFLDKDGKPVPRDTTSSPDNSNLGSLDLGTPEIDRNDMGGTDFGISDNSSWDDSSGGDSDWN